MKKQQTRKVKVAAKRGGGKPSVQRGFSLIELMVTIGLAAVLLGLAAPSFNTTLKNNRMTTQANELVSALNIARQAAIANGVYTMVCPSNSADSNAPACNDTGSSWSTGVLVYSKKANTGGYATASVNDRRYDSSTDEIVHSAKFGNPSNFTVANTNADDLIGFATNGLELQRQGFEISYCDDRTGDYGRVVNVSAAGRISTATKTCT